MTATVPNVTSGSGLRKFQADGFLFDRVYMYRQSTGRHVVPGRLQLLVGWSASRAYKEGDIKFVEFCGVAWRASRDGGLLQLL